MSFLPRFFSLSNVCPLIVFDKIDFDYLNRNIYADPKFGDQNDGGTKIWGFFPEIPKFPNFVP